MNAQVACLQERADYTPACCIMHTILGGKGKRCFGTTTLLFVKSQSSQSLSRTMKLSTSMSARQTPSSHASLSALPYTESTNQSTLRFRFP